MSILFLLLAALLTGCATGAGQAAGNDYVTRLQPLLVENSALAEQILIQSAGIYNEAVGPKDIAVAWEQKVVPLSEHLAQQATFVTPPPEYQARHAELVQIWAERAAAYRAMAEATRTANADQWNAARTKVDQVKTRESAFFNGLNSQLQPLNLQVDPYP